MIRKGLLVLGLTFAGLVLVASPASAVIINFAATISGAQEVPPTPSPATGSAMVTLDTDTNLLSWNITFTAESLLGTTTASHFHGPAPAGMNAPVIVNINLTPGFGSPQIGMATISEEHEAFFLAGLTYINIHTTAFPGGEIRGQVLQVPEPSGLLLMSAGLGLVLGARRRRFLT
jgi:hypothetical protein